MLGREPGYDNCATAEMRIIGCQKRRAPQSQLQLHADRPAKAKVHDMLGLHCSLVHFCRLIGPSCGLKPDDADGIALSLAWTICSSRKSVVATKSALIFAGTRHRLLVKLDAPSNGSVVFPQSWVRQSPNRSRNSTRNPCLVRKTRRYWIGSFQNPATAIWYNYWYNRTNNDLLFAYSSGAYCFSSRPLLAPISNTADRPSSAPDHVLSVLADTANEKAASWDAAFFMDIADTYRLCVSQHSKADRTHSACP